MASVILLDLNGTEHTVTTTRDFNARVYGLGWYPKTGTIAEAYNILVSGGPETPQFYPVINQEGVGRIRVMTQAAYNALTPKITDTLYVIVG